MLATTFETVRGGRRLRVARLGSGPPLVLLHGYPDNLQIWCELAPRLAGRFTVIALDWPGMGYSDAWPGGATPAHMADRLRELLDAWHIDRAGLVGLDMGGQPALAFAARHPERLRHLVVMNSLVFGDEVTSWEIRLLRKFGWNRFLIRRLPWLVFYRAERTFLPRGVRLPAALRADLWEGFRRGEVRRFISKMCAGYQGTLPRLPELYGRITCPTLVLWGECDKHFPPVQAERLHAAIPGSHLQVVPGGEHWMVWHCADEVAERIRDFLESGLAAGANIS
jgi:pimeloyl-ACP methyl ester carboxylesterase